MANGIQDEIRFGTDGWRGVIADNFTFKNVKIVSQAISEWVKRDCKADKTKAKRVAIGYDTRFLSKEFAECVAGVLAANGIQVLLSDSAVPTPALSYAVTRKGCVAGLMLTASHNPGKFNGIKIKSAQGGAASKEVTDLVETYLGKGEVQMIDFAKGVEKKTIDLQDLKKDYLAFIADYIDLKKMKRSRFRVICDAMHGSGDGLIPRVLRGTGIELTLMRDDVNPSFEGGKPEPVVEYLDKVMERVKKEKFDLGLVLDGDADRIAAVAAGGEFIHPQKILGLLALHLYRNRGQRGGVVKTICGTTMIDNIANSLGVKLYETPVGFKYISDLMITEDILVGGEEAGGMGVQHYIPERDGTLAGLLLLEMMVFEKKNIRQIIRDMEKEFGRYYYERSDLPLGKKAFKKDKIKSTRTLLGKKVVDVKTYDGVKLICEDESWLMFRPSGTEPLVRVYSEARSAGRAKKLIDYGNSLIK